MSGKKICVAKAQRNAFMKKANVIGVGVGKKYKNGVPTEQGAVICFVKQKVDKKKLKKEDLLPKTATIGEDVVPIDVVEVGTIRALTTEHRFNRRPLVTGISCGHFAVTAGTLGLFVEKGGKPFILSNNHILANNNVATIGDPIYQPGPVDGGRSRHTVARLAEFVPIRFAASARNKVDAALALVVGYEGDTTEEPAPITPPEPKKLGFFEKLWQSIVGFFRRLFGGKAAQQNVNVVVDGKVIEGNEGTTAPLSVEFSNTVLNMPIAITGEVADVWEGDAVQKSGRTTGHTTDAVIATDVTVEVEFGAGQYAVFEGQTVAGGFSAGGDSGSAIFDMQGNAVGLLFAGSDTVTIFSPMKTVFKELGIDRIWR